MNKSAEVNETWHNPAVREENAHTDYRNYPGPLYMATLSGTALEVDTSRAYIERKYAEKPSVTLWEARKGLPRRQIRPGNRHF